MSFVCARTRVHACGFNSYQIHSAGAKASTWWGKRKQRACPLLRHIFSRNERYCIGLVCSAAKFKLCVCVCVCTHAHVFIQRHMSKPDPPLGCIQLYIHHTTVCGGSIHPSMRRLYAEADFQGYLLLKHTHLHTHIRTGPSKLE